MKPVVALLTILVPCLAHADIYQIENIYRTCLDTATMKTEILQCDATANKAAIVELNKSYNAAIESIRKNEAGTIANPKLLVSALVASQHAWSQFKDSSCNYVYQTVLAADGNGSNEMALACHTTMTIARVKELLQ